MLANVFTGLLELIDGIVTVITLSLLKSNFCLCYLAWNASRRAGPEPPFGVHGIRVNPWFETGRIEATTLNGTRAYNFQAGRFYDHRLEDAQLEDAQLEDEEVVVEDG